MKIKKIENSSKFTATFTAEELKFADLACRKIFKSSLVEVMSDLEENNECMPVEIMKNMIVAGKGFYRSENKTV